MKKITSILFFALFLVGMVSAQDVGLKVGDLAPDFKLKNTKGEFVSLSTHTEAKGAVVIFTCNHCPYSKLYEDRIIDLHNEYAKQGFPVIAINPNDAVEYPSDSYEEMKIRAKEKGFTFDYVVDESQAIAKQYGAERTPHVYVLSKQEKGHKVEYIGAIDDNAKSAKGVEENFLRKALDNLVSGKAADPNFTKAVGCSIKWKKS